VVFRQNNKRNILIKLLDEKKFIYIITRIIIFHITMQNRSYSASAKDIAKEWFIIDAKDAVIGRLSVYVANILRGKHKAIYTPHIDCGDNVIIINADLAKFTGKKFSDKIYYRHTGFPGGLKEESPKSLNLRGFYKRALEMSIRRMMGTNGPLSRARMKNLYIYSGAEHKQTAQKPTAIDFASLNRKNTVQN
jgi:large subunit ribosomal protein L13